MTDALNDETASRITALCAEGDELSGQGEYHLALEKYEAALRLIPEPHTRWEASTWVLAAIGDTYYLTHEFAKARAVLQAAMHCPGAIGNPFLHLRLGEAQYELGDMARAADELARAYMGAGQELFEREDPKYYALVRTSLRNL